MLLRYTRYMEHYGREASLRNSALKTITKHDLSTMRSQQWEGKKPTTLELVKEIAIHNMEIITFQCLKSITKGFQLCFQIASQVNIFSNIFLLV